MSNNSIQQALLADDPNALQRKPKRFRRCRSAPRSDIAEIPEDKGARLPAKELFKKIWLLTTLGYGDKSFSSKSGRTFAVLWIITSTVIVALFFIYLVEIYTERRQKMLAKRVLTRRMTAMDLEASDRQVGFTTMDLEAADLDSDGQVGVAEFVVYRLKELGKITQEDICSILERFDQLDADQSGTLTLSDIALSQSGQR